MTDSELDKILRRAKTPEPAAVHWDALCRRIARAIQANRDAAPDRAAPRWRLGLAWGLAVAAACVAAGLVLGPWRGEPQNAPVGRLLENAKLVDEVLTMFPNRLRAIVQDAHGLRLLLSETNDVPDSTPLFIEVRNGRQASAYVTFSGQEVPIDGQAVTVLSDARGGVILVGNRFLWSNRKPVGAAVGLRIQARRLRRLSEG